MSRSQSEHLFDVESHLRVFLSKDVAANAIPEKRISPFLTMRDGTKLFIRDWGRGEVLVFLAGWGLPSDMWFYQMAPLAMKGFRCIAYDRRGHGRSTDPGYGYSYDALSDDLMEVLHQSELDDVTLVGHSMAAGEMVRFLSRHGEGGVKRLVFVSPSGIPFPPNGSDGDFQAFREGRLLEDFPQWLDENGTGYFTPSTSAGIIDYTKRLMLQTSLQALYECHRTATSTDFREELAEISVPTLVMCGDRDVSAPLEIFSEPAAKMIPGARLKVYRNGPHGMYFTHKDRLNGDLMAFCREESGW